MSIAEAGSYIGSEPFDVPEWMAVYEPQSKKMQERWPMTDSVKIEYDKGKIVSKVYATSLIRDGAASRLKASINLSMSESGSLRSKEAAILGSRMSCRQNDVLL